VTGSPALLTVSAADLGWIVLSLFLMFLSLSLVVLSLTWLERKVLARLQRRLGPNRTGPMGVMQPLADAVKLLLKEDIVPTSANRAIFWAAPLIVVVSAFMIWVTIPGARDAAIRNLDLGLFYIIAFAVLAVAVLKATGAPVKITRPDGFLNGYNVEIYKNLETDKIVKIIAQEQVEMRDEDIFATSDYADLNQVDDTVDLRENVVVIQEEDRLEAKAFTYNRQTGKRVGRGGVKFRVRISQKKEAEQESVDAEQDSDDAK